MSAAGRNENRRENDFYATPDWLVDAIMPHLPVEHATNILEPGCGTGAILKGLVRAGVENRLMFGVDINEYFVETLTDQGFFCFSGDFLKMSFGGAFDLCVMNPPYKLAMEFVEKARQVTEKNGTVAALLRLNFLGSQRRKAWLRANPCDIYVSPRRPSFTGQGTDATDYAWFVWRPSRSHEVFILDT